VKIGIDLDGVVFDYQAYFIDEFNTNNGTNFTKADWTDHYFSKTGLSPQAFWAIVKEHSDTEAFKYLTPIEGAREGIRELHRKNSIHIITHRIGHAQEDAVYSLNANNIPYESISFTASKGKMCYILGIDVAIDDVYEKCEDMAKYGIETLLMDWPWNQCETIPLIQRVNNWSEIVDILK